MTKKLSKSLEDYLEAILMICDEKGVARVKDIAAKLGVKAASVTEALHHLAGLGLVNYEPYSVISLTEAGKRRASEILTRHRVLTDFLNLVIGIEVGHAEELACVLEHIIKDEDFDRFRKFTSLVKELDLSDSLLSSLEKGECTLTK